MFSLLTSYPVGAPSYTMQQPFRTDENPLKRLKFAKISKTDEKPLKFLNIC